ncbi:MAG: NAD(P)/FAD-dependent oxidoreductase [Methanocorpusculum sp.]|nr:NAD(P)/FAD-dependent oxidoreductase [Methanocorpusculum sp.]
MNIAIIGSGLTGLTAALKLADKNSIVVFEKNNFAGGCLSSKKYNNKYTLETLYHHCFSGDRELLALIDSLNLRDELIWLKGSTGYFAKGKLESVTTPFEILKWSALTFFQKFRLALFVLSSRKIDTDALDKITAKEYLIDKVGEDVYNAFFAPLLRSKFGEMKDEVSAAWLMSRIAIRSDRGAEGERLGYIKGGWHKLIDAMSDSLHNKGVDIRLGVPAENMSYNGKWIVNDEEFDAVISTVPHQVTKSLIQEGSGFDLPEITYQGAACMTLGLKRDVTNGIYWTNMGDEAPYGAVVTHTNFAPFDLYGEHVVYLASYFKDTVPENLETRMIDDFCKRFKLEKSEIIHSDMYIDKFAGPVFVTGYKGKIPRCEAGNNLYTAGMFSEENYPERSMEGSVRAGIRTALLVSGKN